MPTLDWLNRASAFNTAARVPYRLLERMSVHAAMPSLPARPDPASVRPKPVEGSAASTGSTRTDIADNLLIQGDNLEALKALLMVCGEACRLRQERLTQAKVTFSHISFDVRAR